MSHRCTLRQLLKKGKKTKHFSAPLLLSCQSSINYIGFYKTETEICRRKDDDKKTDIDRYGQKPFSNICQLPDPPPFSLNTAF